MADSKYHQVAVPDHPGGSSFTRVGSFPSSGDPAPLPSSFERSRGMAALTSASRVTTSGHWTHTDGNRINTTVGNVVDVIHGTYLAYRSAAASPPGKTLAASWAESVYTQVGSSDTPIGTPGASPTDPTGSPPDCNIAYKDSFVASGADTGADAAEGDSKAAQGDVLTATWAARVITYVGSSGTTVPYVFTQTYGDKVATYTYTTKGNVTLNTATGGDVSATTNITGGGSSVTDTTVGGGGSINTVSTITGGGSSNTTTDVTGGDVNSFTTVKGGNAKTTTEAVAITELSTAVAISEVNTALNHFAFTIGIVEEITLGAQVSLDVGAIAAISIGPQMTVDFPEHLQFEGLKTTVSIQTAEAKVVSDAIAAVNTRVSAADTKIGEAHTKIAAAETSIAEANTKIATEQTQINTLFSVLSGEILLA